MFPHHQIIQKDNMPPKKMKQQQSASTKVHSYNNVKELIVTDGESSAPGPVSAPANSTAAICFVPVGVNAPRLGSGPTVSSVVILKSSLVWLRATAVNFREYRVTRAQLIVVGGNASTATGNFNVTSSKDYLDFLGPTAPSYSTGPPGTSVASLAEKNATFNLNIDTSWKVVSRYTAVALADQVSFIPVHNVGDLSFGGFAISNNSALALGTFYLNYDVQFRGPINAAINA
jgi:hypothetical protein